MTLLQRRHPVVIAVLVAICLVSLVRIAYRQARTAVAIRAVQRVQRLAKGYVEREPLADECIGGEMSPQECEFRFHDVCAGELVLRPTDTPSDAPRLVSSPSGATCNMGFSDWMLKGEPDLTVIYRGRHAEPPPTYPYERGYTAEARVPWLFWTIVARGSGTVVERTTTSSEVVVTVE